MSTAVINAHSLGSKLFVLILFFCSVMIIAPRKFKIIFETLYVKLFSKTEKCATML